MREGVPPNRMTDNCEDITFPFQNKRAKYKLISKGISLGGSFLLYKVATHAIAIPLISIREVLPASQQRRFRVDAKTWRKWAFRPK